MQAATWVVGRGGLLGSAVGRALRDDAPRLSVKLGWRSAQLAGDLRQGAEALAGSLRGSVTRWQVCWCAGAGVVGTDAATLAEETMALRQLLEALLAQPALRGAPGSFALSSSAGGLYGGCAVPRIDEATSPRPLSAYGAAKLEQERLLSEMAPQFGALSTLTARFSNLYGPGQHLDKPQGLISHMARAVISRQPVRIYVPFDTMRDYLFADDAARLLLAGLERLKPLPQPVHVAKIYASERDTSIASLVSLFRQVAKRRLLVASGLHQASSQQPRRLSFRSTVWPEDRQRAQMDLLAGIGAVFRAQLQAHTAGRLASAAKAL